LHAFEVQGASRSIGGATSVVMPRLDEDFIGSVLPEADVAKFYAEFEAELELGRVSLCELHRCTGIVEMEWLCGREKA